MPVLWGGLACLAFYSLISKGAIQNELIRRYFASHPVEYITSMLFFVGMAALILKALDLASQLGVDRRVDLGPPLDSHDTHEASRVLARLDELPDNLRNGYLVRRVRDAAEYVQRKASATTLERQLRHLSDLDAERAYADGALVRIIVWAIPILGFLGTVIGITLAIANLEPEALENSLPNVTSGLGVAFDTTALALGLSLVLMFAKFGVDRLEGRLLTRVDERVTADLSGRFRGEALEAGSQLSAVRTMADTVVESTERLVERQAELWRSTIDSAHRQWSHVSSQLGQQLETTLGDSLETGLKRHAETLTAAEQEMAAENRRHWELIRESLSETATLAAQQQAELIRQGDLLRRVVEATDQVQQLESTLNDNLSALAGAGNFEQTVLSLSAAIQLLNARLSPGSSEPRRIDLHSKHPAGNAA
jgi:biopolymer transport protein ExbB/TolQ